MDDDLQQLEGELKRLRPVAPPRRLAAAVERSLAHAPGRRNSPGPVRWWWLAGLPVAAAMAMGLVQLYRIQHVPPAAEVPVSAGTRVTAADSADSDTPFKPVAAENVLVSASDEGLVTLGDGTPARRERRHYVDTITWKNPQTNASLRWSVPREEVRVVPIAFQ